MEDSTKEFWQGQLIRRNSDPSVWLIKSEQFEHAARIILERYNSARSNFRSNPEEFLNQEKIGLNSHDLGLVDIFFYLIGTSIELALKGIYISINNNFSENVESTGHDLINLAKLVNLELSTAEKKILRQLIFCLHWTSKYPVPKLKKQSEWDLTQITGTKNHAQRGAHHLMSNKNYQEDILAILYRVKDCHFFKRDIKKHIEHVITFKTSFV